METPQEEKKETRIACWFCGADLIWNADFSFEDFGLEGEGIVATLTCTGCEADAHFRAAQPPEPGVDGLMQ